MPLALTRIEVAVSHRSLAARRPATGDPAGAFPVRAGVSLTGLALDLGTLARRLQPAVTTEALPDRPADQQRRGDDTAVSRMTTADGFELQFGAESPRLPFALTTSMPVCLEPARPHGW